MSNEKAYPIKERISEKSYLKGMDDYKSMYEKSIKDPKSFWLDISKRLDWFSSPTTSSSGDFEHVNYSWFLGGKLNASYNCIDRHLEKRANKSAFIWVKDEPGQYEHITYQQLFENVSRLTNLMKRLWSSKRR